MRSAGRPGLGNGLGAPPPVPLLVVMVLLVAVPLFGVGLLLVVVAVVVPRPVLIPEAGCQGIGARQMGQSGSAPAQLLRNCRRQPV